jgi:glutaredoxin 3
MTQVTIYTKTGCPYCAAALEDLKAKGIDVEEVNVTKDRDRISELVRVSGGRKVPVIVKDSKVTVGFNGY